METKAKPLRTWSSINPGIEDIKVHALTEGLYNSIQLGIILIFGFGSLWQKTAQM